MLYIYSLIFLGIWLVYLYKKFGQKNTTILGEEMAKALLNERIRVKSDISRDSPLNNINYNEYLNEKHLLYPLYNPTDNKIIQIIDQYCKSSDQEEIRKSLSIDDIYTLITFSKRSSVLALHQKKLELIKSAIHSLAMIELARCDYRDIMLALSIINYSAEILQFKPSTFIENITVDLDDDLNAYFKKYFNEIASKHSMEAISGYQPIQIKDSIGFVNTSYKKYNPKNPLHEFLYDISNVVYEDNYMYESITVAEEIPPIWLSAESNKEFSEYYEDLNGCASLNTGIKSGQNKDNMLLIYILEFSNTKSPKSMMTKVHERNTSKFSRMLILNKNILCIILARSIVVGKKDYESIDTLKRFETRIRNILTTNVNQS